MNIPVIVNDEKGFKDVYSVKPSREVVNKKNYFKTSKYEKPKEEFDEMFEQENDISYNPEYFRENLEL